MIMENVLVICGIVSLLIIFVLFVKEPKTQTITMKPKKGLPELKAYRCIKTTYYIKKWEILFASKAYKSFNWKRKLRLRFTPNKLNGVAFYADPKNFELIK